MEHQTIPVSPRLLTKTRVRPVEFLSMEEKENKEVEEMKRYHFKARPVPKSLFKTSKPFEFTLPDRKRHYVKAPVRSTRKEIEEKVRRSMEKQIKQIKTPQFKAQTLNKKIFTEVLGVPQRAAPHVTTPTPFVLRTEMRAEKGAMETLIKAKEEKEKNYKYIPFKANPMPHYPPPLPKDFPQTKLEQKPFHLETEIRGKISERHRLMKMEEQLKMEEKQRMFSANPSNTDKAPFVPVHPPHSSLETCPFRLLTEERGAAADARLAAARVAAEAEAAAPVHIPPFHARGARVLKQPPFKPAKNESGLVTPVTPVLHSRVRALKREKFDSEAEKRAQEKDAQKKEEEKKEVKKYRKGLLFHANPIKASLEHADFIPKKGLLPVTDPHTPFVLKRSLGSYKEQWSASFTEGDEKRDDEEKEEEEEDDEEQTGEGLAAK